MTAEPCIDKLVADSAAFLRNLPLHHMAREVITCPAVVAEIRDKATRDRLQVLPYELQMREPSDEAVRQVSEFSRQTGDLRFLSATDLRVLALTLQVTRETLGDQHLRLQPPAALDRAQVTLYHPKNESQTQLPVGFVRDEVANLKLSDDQDCGKQTAGDGAHAQGDTTSQSCESASRNSSSEAAVTNSEKADDPCAADTHPDTGAEHRTDHTGAEVDDPHSEEMYDAKEFQEDDSSGGEDDDAEDEGVEEEEDAGSEDGDDGWITPANIHAARAEMDRQAGEVNEAVKVACLTTDFTMQNVLKRMNLEIVSVEGRRIREVKRFVLRCFGCFQTTPNMEKQFCPWCGHKTLKRVSVTLRRDGTQQIHISTRKPISKRGTKFSLPLPRGGKYSMAPVVCGDQPLPQQRATARSKAINAILSEDFVHGASPFSMRDVDSRAAQLGRSGQRRNTPNWERRNPNARAPPTGNKKKRRK